MTTKSKFHSIGFEHGNFKVTKSLEISELQCHLYELFHIPTGAQVMHIANEDPENLFCLSFQTLPSTSNGIAHILEHTVLCGSKKFPVKDPFFAMTRRSLNTFMNALTGADFTCYPAATQVHKDFYNLLEVYLDAVFHPNLNPLSFLQEGHRLEFAIPDDPNTPLEFKGIVFNEMKGAMSSANARLYEIIHSSLFPDLTYGHNAGGNPHEIPSLTYNELVEFHNKFYHPSRCLFFFYGNMPLADHLDFIEEHALKDSSKAPPLPPLPRQPRFKEKKYVFDKYPIGSEDEIKGKTVIAFAWLTCHILEQEELLALSLIEAVLLDTDASPLKKALLRSGLCTQISSYLDTDLSEVPFLITLKGCEPENQKPLEDLILTTLAQIAEIGIPLKLIENALHQLEFHGSEIGSEHGPYGLSLFMRSALLKQHGASPEVGLKIHSLSEAVRKKNLDNPRYFSELIEKYLINNPHSVGVVLEPDPNLTTQELSEERSALEKIKEKLSYKECKELVEQAASLSEFQKMQEEVDQEVLPRVTHDDVPKIARDYLLTHEKIGNLQVFHHSVFTNDIIYADLVYNLPKIDEHDLPLVRLFAILLPQMGCGGRNYADNLEYIQAHVGGMGASLTFNLQAADSNKFSPSLYIRGKALHRKADKLFSLMLDMASTADFTDLQRLRETIMKHFTSLHSSLQQSSLKYAINLSASPLDFPSMIANSWYGLEYYWRIKKIAENIDKELPLIAEKLQILNKMLLGLENPHLIVTSDALTYDELKGHHFYGLESIETKPSIPWSCEGYQLPIIEPQGRITSTPIAFISKVFKTAPYAHPHAPALNIAAFLFDNLVLHTKIREQGGAYGCGAMCNSMAANFYFYSYRDPNIHSTLEAFEEAVKEISAGHFDEDDLEEAKLEMIQTLDTPISPGSRGDLAYGWLREGKPHALRQKFRTAVLSLTKEQVIEAIKEEIIPQMKKGTPVIFAGKELLDKENAIRGSKGLPPISLERI